MAEIKWHESAREHLRQIFDFNIDHFSETYAYSILGEVLDEVQDLEKFPKKVRLNFCSKEGNMSIVIL